MSDKTILVWFRNDLRIRDNEILLEAVRKADKVLPVYCFDPYYFQKNESGNSKTGILRTRFLIESVADLRNNIRNIGGELLIRVGNPAEIISQIAEEYQVSEVYHHREVAYEETRISEEVEAALWKKKLNLKHFIGHTLYHKEDLPFPIKDIPDSFAIFKKKVERDSTVRPCIGTPQKISTPEITDAGELPSLTDLGLCEAVDDPRADTVFKGGETVALQQLKEILVCFGQASQIKNAKSSSSISESSSKLSPWITLGCISLRQVYHDIIDQQSLGNAQHQNALLLHLLWRDYFRFMFKKHGQKFIAPKGAEEELTEISLNEKANFEGWKNGETGIPLIDAIMHQLNATGYINNQGRQIVAGYLIHNLKVDWKKGAGYFEEKLIDYSPASNWGNWAFIAGVNNAHDSKYAINKVAVEKLENNSDFITKWSSHNTSANYQAI